MEGIESSSLDDSQNILSPHGIHAFVWSPTSALDKIVIEYYKDGWLPCLWLNDFCFEVNIHVGIATSKRECAGVLNNIDTKSYCPPELPSYQQP